MPGWDDNAATFEMTIVANNLHGDYQLANGYGHDRAKEVLKVTLPFVNTFIFISCSFEVIITGRSVPFLSTMSRRFIIKCFSLEYSAPTSI